MSADTETSNRPKPVLRGVLHEVAAFVAAIAGGILVLHASGPRARAWSNRLRHLPRRALCRERHLPPAHVVRTRPPDSQARRPLRDLPPHRRHVHAVRLPSREPGRMGHARRRVGGGGRRDRSLHRVGGGAEGSRRGRLRPPRLGGPPDPAGAEGGARNRGRRAPRRRGHRVQPAARPVYALRSPIPSHGSSATTKSSTPSSSSRPAATSRSWRKPSGRSDDRPPRARAPPAFPQWPEQAGSDPEGDLVPARSSLPRDARKAITSWNEKRSPWQFPYTASAPNAPDAAFRELDARPPSHLLEKGKQLVAENGLARRGDRVH